MSTAAWPEARPGDATDVAEGAVSRRFGRSDALFCVGLFALALALRLILVSRLGVEPTWDGHYYHQGALSIAHGHGYSEPNAALPGGRAPWSHYPVGYSALLGGVYALFGEQPSVALTTNAIVGALTAVVGFAFALPMLGRRRARFAGALIAFHPGLSLYCVLVMTEPLAGLLMLSSACFASLLGRRRWAAAAAGAVLSLAGLVRPQSLLIGPLLFFLFPRGLRFRATQTLIAGAASLMLLVPWTLRNCLVLDACAAVSTNGGWNLAIGALSETGRYRALTADDGCSETVGPVEQDRCWAEVGLAAISKNPVEWASRAPDKLRHTYNHESFAVAYIAEARPDDWDRDRKWGVMNWMTGFHHLLMLAAAFGLISRFDPRRWRQHWGQIAAVAGLLGFAAYALTLPERPLFWIGVALPVLGFAPLPGAPRLDRRLGYLLGVLAVTSLTHVVFFGDDRYHLAISPIFCLLAAGAFRRSRRDLGRTGQLPSPSPRQA